MGALGVVILSFVLLFTFSGVSRIQNHFAQQGMAERYLWIRSEAEIGRLLSRTHEYEPPSRRAVIVDISGMEHTSADGSHMPRRDRSWRLPSLQVGSENGFFSKIFQNKVSPLHLETDLKTESGRSAQMSTPLEPIQLSAPLATVSPPMPIEQESAHEKEYITDKVDQIAGSEKVDNRLRAL